METDLVAGLPVLSNGKLVGMVTKTDILKVEPSKRAEKTVNDVMTRQLVLAYPGGRPVFSAYENDDERRRQTSSRLA